MKKFVLLLILALILSGHDMYLKFETYFLEPNSRSTIMLFNGTFERSDNTIDRNRMLDVSLVGNGARTEVDTTQWTEENEATILNFTTGKAGTWVAGVSTRPRNIKMEAQAFNDYLAHDGVLDMLEWRKQNDVLDQDAVESYSKHVKTVFQVGDKRTSDWQTRLGYPIEFVPLANPYDMHPDHLMQVELLFDGKPLKDHLVYVGSTNRDHEHPHGHTHTHDDSVAHHHEHEHDQSVSERDMHAHSQNDHEHKHGEEDHDSDDHHHDLAQYRTDENGRISFKLTHKGTWYIRTIHLARSQEDGLTHESNWATLTFEIGDGHDRGRAQGYNHTEHNEREGGIPGYMYWAGALLLVGLFFLILHRRTE